VIIWDWDTRGKFQNKAAKARSKKELLGAPGAPSWTGPRAAWFDSQGVVRPDPITEVLIPTFRTERKKIAETRSIGPAVDRAARVGG
jgi:hypothetical protein